MRILWTHTIWLGCLLACPGASGAGLMLPLEIRQASTPYNLQSLSGVPISTTAGLPPGSDGRMPESNSSGSQNTPTNQFQGFVFFGGIAAPTNSAALKESVVLQQGTTAFSGDVATQMQLPRGVSDGVVSIILRRAQAGAPYLSRQVSFAFGSVVPVPDTDEFDQLLTNVVKETYWLPEPYAAGSQADSGFYWSPHARKVYAIQPGPITVTWRKAAAYNTVNVPSDYNNANGTVSFATNGSSIHLLYTVRYVASGSAVKPPRKMYWTERSFRNLGKPVAVPTARVSAVNIVFNSNFPKTVPAEYVGPGHTSPTDGTTNQVMQELRTLWYDQSLGNIYAYNQEGRVFVELLGDARPDGQSREHLGFEIVDVYQQPMPADVTVELGERVLPPPPGSASNLFAEPVLQPAGLTFAYQHNREGSDKTEFYATRQTSNLNDYLVHWTEAGLVDLKWPSLFARYNFVWPSEVAKYSHYIRPAVASENEAKQTAVTISTQNAPVIEFQDPLDRPRAKFTEDFRFYTFLDLKHPAHRTLLRFSSGDEVAFERVFSWLDASLKTGNFSGSVAEGLSAWNSTNHVFTWPSALTAPRVVNETVNVGQRIVAPLGERGSALDQPYVAGYINEMAGNSFNVNAYVSPFANAFTIANHGAIIPVNAIPGKNLLEVWWFRVNTGNAGLNSGNTAKGFETIHWPSAIGRYTIQWPGNPREIVLASRLGSGTLNSFQAQGNIYAQNNPVLPGYNPNEEHALMSGGMAFALRDDLNLTEINNYSSHPFVLLDYQAEDGRPAMAVFRVLREKPEAGWVFDYIVPAGQPLQPPPPLGFLAKPVEGSGDAAINYNQEVDQETSDLPAGWRQSSDPYEHYQKFTWQDRKNDFWVYRGLHSGLPALQAGRYIEANGTFTSLADATAVAGQPFTQYIHVSRQDEYLGLRAPEGLPDWLKINGMVLEGTPSQADVSTNTLQLVIEDLYDGSRATNQLTLRTVAAGSVAAQGPLEISCTNSFTGTVVTYSNRPPFLAKSPQGSNSFSMRFYYKTEPGFDWPGVANPPPPGSIVPYLRRFDSSSGTYLGDRSSKQTESLAIVYRPVWPVRDPKDSSKPLPSLPFGATLTMPAFGLPGVRDMRTAQVLYQQSIAAAANVSSGEVSAVLHDATRAKVSDLVSHGLQKLPSGVHTDYYLGNYYFPNLPPHLAARFFFDPNRGAKGSLVLIGEFHQEAMGENFILLNVLRGLDLAAVKALCPVGDQDYTKWKAAVDALATKVETFYENPARPGTYIPNPAWTVSVVVTNLAVVTNANTAVDSYALSATGPGSGYVTLVESSGTAFTQPGDPVSMHIFKVGGELYLGETKLVLSANPLNEQITFQHTADLAGRSEEYEYEWKIAAPVDGVPPLADSTMSRYLSLAKGLDIPRYTLGGAGIQALGDNYVVMRYRPVSESHPLRNQWSNWTTPKLAEGWIKRVLAGINPFNQRVSDLFNNRVNTDVSLLTQAGRRWEGDVALNLETINNYGLIEIYETLLRRGRMLSIESGFNYGPANDALLLAAGYLSDLYMMLGNEAWADAANPTIGIGTSDHTYSEIATALFAFRGQVPSLLEEELALLRGRDDFMQPGVEVVPVYNRLVWNYTRGIDAGEVIYAINYNIHEDPTQSADHNIDASDAMRMFPQGHGDAFGHYLTSLKVYYSLLMNSCFDWVPRSEAVNVLGQPVQVAYQDERKFAAAASALARAGRQTFDLTWRRDYQPVRTSGWEHFGATRTNTQRTYVSSGTTNHTTRYWGADHWASRTAQGAYMNWVVGNAILPEIDPNPAHEGIQKIDRTTVPELQELAALAGDLQIALDNAEAGLSPLGLPEGALAFDINPAVVVGSENGTHFEQVYQRAKAALGNALVSFDDAKDVTRRMRSEQDSLADFQAAVAGQEHAYNNALIEIYGTPYPDDIGPGKLYRQGYNGPDLIHFSYVDMPELTFPGLIEPRQATEFKIDIQQYTGAYDDSLSAYHKRNKKADRFDFVIRALQNSSDYIENTHYISFTLDAHGFFQKPADWTSRRASPGKVQEAISRIILARNAALQALSDDSGAKYQLDRRLEMFQAKLDRDDESHAWDKEKAIIQTSVETAIFAAKMFQLGKNTFSDGIEKAAKATTEAIPQSLIVGVASGGDTLSAARGSILAAAATAKSAADGLNFAKEFAVGAFTLSQEGYTRIQEAYVMGPLRRSIENQGEVYELDMLLSELQGKLFTINQRLQELDDAQRQYRALVAEGDRLQEERYIFRQRSAAVIHGFRTRDAALRIFRNEKLERYKTLFDLSARYALLAANAYDYETGLLNTPQGRSFVRRIINSRALGVIRNGEPQYAGSNTGDPGLSSALAEMKADWDLLRGRLGFNNPDAYGTTVSLRREAWRILPGADGDLNWKDKLQAARVGDLLEDPDVRRHCLQIGSQNGLPVPGLLVEFSTTIADGYNLFGRPLAAGDHSFSPTAFATKIFGVGVAFEGYRGMDNPAANSGAIIGAGGTSPSDPNTWFLDPLALAATPYVYLVPVGVDAMRSPPLGDASAIRTWMVDDVAIPMPFNIGASDFSSRQLYLSSDSLTEPLFTLRKHQAFRPVSNTAWFSSSLYGASGTLQRSQFTNNRLVGRSVWNSRWKLVIPGKTLLHDPNEGLDRFLQTVTDVKLHFVTYSYSGN
jgi:hypothetical protein